MDLLQKIVLLSDAWGVSGDEAIVAHQAEELLRPLVDRTTIDDMGNLVGYRISGRKGALKLMLDAHLDQVGLMVTEVTDTGFARFAAIGVDPRMLLSREMVVMTDTGPIWGVVSALPPHMQRPGDDKKTIAVTDMLLDLGMDGGRARKLVKVGDLATFDAGAIPLLNGLVSGKALDNRSGFACLLQALEALGERELPYDLIVVGSSREETGFYGSAWRAEVDRPDYFIAVDVCHARTGDNKPYDRVHEMGGGPVIGLGANSVPRFANMLIDVACRSAIPYQIEAIPKSSHTNAWAAQTTATGTVSAVVSLPIRYMHSPVETLCIEDAIALSRLIADFCLSFDGGFKRGEDRA